MRWGKPAKNKKRRDPRYFLNEVDVDMDVDSDTDVDADVYSAWEQLVDAQTGQLKPHFWQTDLAKAVLNYRLRSHELYKNWGIPLTRGGEDIMDSFEEKVVQEIDRMGGQDKFEAKYGRIFVKSNPTGSYWGPLNRFVDPIYPR